MSSSHSRFEAVSRRAFVTRAVALGALVAVPGLACSSDDKQTFASPAATTPPPTSPPSSSSPSTTAPSTTDASSVPVDGSDASVASSASSASGSFPSGGSLVVTFTYAAVGGGQVHNPYIAVWIEDSQGELVRTVSLWYKERDSKYLNELQRWASVEAAFDSAGQTDPYDTVSGATRVAGDYSVMWDGTDASGAPVGLGDYFVCVEAAREKGPYELVRGPVTIGATASTTPLADNGELTGASVELVV
jgi:hypothetical protein